MAATPAGATEPTATDRLAGQTRYSTAVDIATEEFPDATTAILATGEKFPDALAGSGIAGENNAPILLTQSDDLPDVVDNYLSTSAIQNVIVLGGVNAVSEAVVDELQTDGMTVERIAGEDRFETAADIAMEIGAPEINGESTVFVATGFEFADALAAGPLAFHGPTDAEGDAVPILLVGDDVPASTEAALAALNVERIIILGGTNAVSASTENELETMGDADAERIAGDTRFETAQALAQFAITEWGFAAPEAAIANGFVFADALAGGPYGGVNEAPILLVTETDVPDATEAFLTNNCESVDMVTALGGTVRINDAVLDEAGLLAQCGTDVAFDAQSVQAGDTLTGTLSGDFASATIAGDCIEGDTVTVDAADDTDADTEGVQFEVATDRTATAGDCEITVTFFDENGDEIDTVTVTIEITERPNAAATTRPELIDAEIVDTITAEEDTASTTIGAEDVGTYVRFCFDEEITGVQAPNEDLFHVYDQHGTQFNGDDANDPGTIEANGNCIVVLFDNVTTDAAAADLTLATVDFGAVTDNEGEENPIGDAPLGTDSDTTTGFTAGVTAAPDLLAVSDFQGSTTNLNQTLVTFTFDEAAFTVNPAGFSLITVNGVEIPCTAVAGQAGGQPTSTEAADTTIQVSCPEDAFGRDITAADIARGVVQEDTVSDTRQTDSDTTPDTGVNVEGNANPLQASDTPDADSTDPDLVAATLQFNATAGEDDTVVFDFDEAVLLVQTNGSTAAGAQFFVYDVNGDQVNGLTATRSTTDASQVIVTFADTVIDEAVGASVEVGAVRAQTGDTTRMNEDDEEGVVNNNTNADVQTAGRTDNPDLVEVRIEDNTATTTTGDVRVVYVFDEDVQVVDKDGEFFLIQSDGTRLVCQDDNAVVGNEGTAAAPDNDNTVICTQFTVADASGQDTLDLASSADVLAAVVGTVDDDAVIGEGDAATGITIDGNTATDLGNPEGAELTTGTTGTPQQ